MRSVSFLKSLVLVAYLLGLAFNQTNSQGYGLGDCSVTPDLPSFNLSQFPLNWYVIGEIPLPLQNINITCAQYQITSLDSATYNFTYSQIDLLTNSTENMNAIAVVQGNSSNSFVLAKPMVIPILGYNFNFTEKVDIIRTDSLSYALIRSCGSFIGLAHAETYSILSTKPTLPSYLVDILLAALTIMGVDTSGYIQYDNSSC